MTIVALVLTLQIFGRYQGILQTNGNQKSLKILEKVFLTINKIHSVNVVGKKKKQGKKVYV